MGIYIQRLPPIGSKVTIRPAFGTGDRILVEVTGHGEHKGRPVFDYDAGRHWAYLSQIVPDVMFQAADGSRHRLGGFVS